MINTFKNCVSAESFDFARRLLIVKSKYLGTFSNYTKTETVREILNNISSESEALLIDLLPNELNVSVSSKKANLGKYSNITIKASLVDQNAEAEALLDDFDNTQVIAIELSNNNSVIYGHKITPLLFGYSEINPTSETKFTGYKLNLTGKVFGKPIRIADSSFEFVNNGLAFDLARTI